MGAVYRARQLSLKRPVAIKLLPRELSEADPSFATRFEREAQAMAGLSHPNISKRLTRTIQSRRWLCAHCFGSSSAMRWLE